MLPTPNLDHLKKEGLYESTYEPAEDTFLLLDALEMESDFLKQLKPSLCLEIGSGSGCVITFLANLLFPWQPGLVSTDINPFALKATQLTADLNSATVDVLNTSLSNGIRVNTSGDGLFDVILFNPPYVPTEGLCQLALNPLNSLISAASPGSFLEAAWAGGIDGRYWIDKVLPLIPSLLSSTGVFYLILLSSNKPDEIRHSLQVNWQLKSTIIISRKCGIETLLVLKIYR